MHQIQSVIRYIYFYIPFGMLFIILERNFRQASTGHGRTYRRAEHKVYSHFSAWALAVLLSLGAPDRLTAAENADNGRIRFQLDYSGNWQATDQYDLENLIELHIIIEEFLIPDTGYAELLFALAPGEADDFLGRGETETLYRGTTTLASELLRKGIRKRSLARGLEAVIFGWPKTVDNNTDSVLLIDEIELVGRGERISLQLVDLKNKEKSRKKDK